MQQHRENEEMRRQGVPADIQSQPLQPVPLAQIIETDDDPEHLTQAEADEIFHLAEQEIQPLLRKMKKDRWIDIAETIVCLSLLGVSLFGIVWQAITYPHTLVILYAKEHPASITATLAIPTRTLAPVTLTRSATTPTTGHGHQDARAATGTLTFYNGQSTPQTIARGIVFTGNDGVKVSTDQPVIVPAANLPAIGETSVAARAIIAGSQGNIAPYDITIALSSDLKVKNEASFRYGRDARDYQAVAQSDLDSLIAQTVPIVNEQIVQSFPVRTGEALRTTDCTTKTTADHALGDEAQTVTVQIVKTCAAAAYSQDELTRHALVAFTHTRPAAAYHLSGTVQTTVLRVSPLSVTLSGTWAYTFSTAYEQDLAEQIAGDTPAQAQASLLKTGVISQVNVPGTLPPAMYITFLVLEGR